MRWHDDRGYGFIDPALGGDRVFVHAQALGAGAARPAEGQDLSFEVETVNGRKRACRVRPLRPVAPIRVLRRSRGPAAWGTASLFALPAFALLWLVVAVAWRVPAWVAGLYAVASVACFAAYALDKAAARGQRWRTDEARLLALGLIGGWPGALLAQQLLRHKSIKARFRAAYWRTVALNVALFLALNAPPLAALLRSVWPV
ncbi:MAG: cold shock and DUF1294 domain-containing protein [Burkholderiaceae bacterium]